jgi:RND superfamily putative drug exporter
VRKVVDPVDRVVADVALLSDGADRIAAVSARTMGVFDSTPRVVAQVKSALAQLHSFVPTLETTIQNTLPQVVQMSAFLKNLSIDFANTGEGGFYLSRKALADPSYQHVRQSMFSSDGTVTRLFVYSDGDKLDLDAAARVQQLEIAAGKATKYGSLVDSKITMSGAAPVAAAVRGALTHDAVLLAVTLLAVVGLVGMWRGAVSGVAVGIGVLASYLAALGISIALWQHLLGRELHASVPLVSFAILAACGVPYLIATLIATEGPSAGTVSMRGAVAPLTALGAVFGGGLVLLSGGSLSALSQVGTVLVIGLGALTAVAHVCIPAAMQDRTQRRTVAASTTTNS